MSLDSIVVVNVSTKAQSVSQAGFGVPLILDYHTHWADRVRTYADLASMVADGFAVTDFAYLAAQALFAQSPRPPQVIVGRRDNAPTMNLNVKPLAANDGVTYSVVINGTSCDYTAGVGATIAEIVTGLEAAINAAALPVAVVANGGVGTETDLDITANVAGTPFTCYVTDDLDGREIGALDTTPDAGIAADLDTVQAVDDTWYGVVPTSQGTPEIDALAAHVEAMRKLLLVTSQDHDILDQAANGDIASTLKAAAYARTALMYSRRPYEFGAAAWFGVMAPKDPGSATWKFKTLAGVTVDVLTATQIASLEAKDCNYYVTVGGVNIVEEGITPSGEYIDVTRGVDWLQARLQERIYSRLVNVDKIPFTDPGIGVVESEIRGQLAEGISKGLLAADPAPTVTVPKASAVAAADKAARSLTGVTFTAELAGAIHQLTINGTVTA